MIGAVTFVLLTERERLEDVVVVEGETFVVEFAKVEMVEVVLLLKEDVDVVMVVAFEDVSSEDEGVEDDKADKVEDADTAVLVAVVVDNDDEGMLDEVMVEGAAAIVEDDDEGAETVVVVVVDIAVAVECDGVVVEGLLSNSIPPSSSSFNRSRKISCD